MKKNVENNCYHFVSNFNNAPIAIAVHDLHLATYPHFRVYHSAGANFIYVELKDPAYRERAIRYLDYLQECHKRHENESEITIEYLANYEGMQKWLYLNGPDYDYNDQEGDVSFNWVDDDEMDDDSDA